MSREKDNIKFLTEKLAIAGFFLLMLVALKSTYSVPVNRNFSQQTIHTEEIQQVSSVALNSEFQSEIKQPFLFSDKSFNFCHFQNNIFTKTISFNSDKIQIYLSEKEFTKIKPLISQHFIFFIRSSLNSVDSYLFS